MADTTEVWDKFERSDENGDEDSRPPLSLLDLDDRFKQSREANNMSRPPQEINAANKGAEQSRPEELQKLYDSKFEKERQDAARLEKLMNSPDEADRKFANRVLKSVDDMEHRNALLNAREKPEQRDGTDRVLDLLESNDKKERLRASEMLDTISSSDPFSRSSGDKLMQMLGGDQKQQQQAYTIIDHLNNKERQQVLGLLESRPDDPGVQRMMEYLGGKPEQRNAAKTMLRTLEISSEEEKKQLLEMLGNPETEDQAFQMLNGLQGPRQCKEMLNLLRDPELKDGAKELIKMLKEGQNINDVQQALRMMGADDDNRVGIGAGDGNIVTDTDRKKAGEWILSLLGSNDEAEKDVAKQLLKVSDLAKREALLNMYADPEHRDIAERLLKMMQDPRDGEMAHKMLDGLRGPQAAEQIRKMLMILDTPKYQRAASELRMMPAADAAHLVNLLPKKFGDGESPGEKVLDMLNDPDKLSQGLKILKAKLGPQETEAVCDLLSKPETENKGKALLNLASRERSLNEFGLPEGPNPAAGPSALLKMYQSASDKEFEAQQKIGVAEYKEREARTETEKTEARKELEEAQKEKEAAVKEKEAALKVMELLENPATKKQAEALLTHISNPKSILRMAEALNNPAERKAAEHVLSMMAVPERAAKAQAFVEMLNSPDEQQRKGAEKLFSMLSDPSQEKEAKALLDAAKDANSMSKLMAMLGNENASEGEKELLKQIKALSSDPNDRKALDNLLGLATSDDPSKQKHAELLAKMLADTELDKQARTILSKLENPQQCAQLMSLLKDPKTAQAGKALVEMLASGKQDQVVGVQNLLALPEKDRSSLTATLPQDNNRAAEKAFNDIITKLANPQTREIAQKALSCAKTREAVQVLSEMLENNSYHKSIEALHAMSSDPNQRAKAETLLSLREARVIDKAVSMLGDEKQKQNAEILLQMLMDTDPKSTDAAISTLRLLSSSDASEQANGNKLMEALKDPERRQNLIKVLGTAGNADRSGALAALLSDPENNFALETLADLFNDENLSDPINGLVPKLAASLNSSDPDTRKEAEHVVQLLNDPSKRMTGLRLLEQMRRNGRRL